MANTATGYPPIRTDGHPGGATAPSSGPEVRPHDALARVRAEDDADRLAHVVLVGGRRDVAALVGGHGEAPADPEKGFVFDLVHGEYGDGLSSDQDRRAPGRRDRPELRPRSPAA